MPKQDLGDKTYYWGVLAGITIGGIAFFLGFILCLAGVTGAIDLIVESGTLNAKIINGTPGVVFFAFGALILWRYKPKTRLEKSKKTITETNGDQNSQKSGTPGESGTYKKVTIEKTVQRDQGMLTSSRR